MIWHKMVAILFKLQENIVEKGPASYWSPGAVFTNHSLERSLSYSPEFSMYRSI